MMTWRIGPLDDGVAVGTGVGLGVGVGVGRGVAVATAVALAVGCTVGTSVGVALVPEGETVTVRRAIAVERDARDPFIDVAATVWVPTGVETGTVIRVENDPLLSARAIGIEVAEPSHVSCT